MSLSLSFINVSVYNFFEGFSCDIEAGSSVLIVTSREIESVALTRLITGMSSPDCGLVLVNGQDVANLDRAGLYGLRRQVCSVPPAGGLISNLKLWENISLPQLYSSGEISAEIEKTGLEYLALLGYAGDIMALPAHLTLHEKRVTALVRAFLCRPLIMIYTNCIEGSPPASRTIFLDAAREFQSADKNRTALYFTSSPELALELPVDRVVRLGESVANVSRTV